MIKQISTNPNSNLPELTDDSYDMIMQLNNGLLLMTMSINLMMMIWVLTMMIWVMCTNSKTTIINTSMGNDNDHNGTTTIAIRKCNYW